MKKQRVYDIIVNNLPAGFSTVEKDGLSVDFNHAAEKISGYSKTEVMGKSHLDILHGTPDRNACPLFNYSLSKRKEAIEAEATLKRKDGAPVLLSVTTAPHYVRQGKPHGG